MKNRRGFLLSVTAALVAAAVIITPVIAEELMGVITNVDVAGKKLTVESKEDGKEVVVTTTDDTEVATKKGSMKIDLEKLAGNVAKIKEAGKKGMPAKVTHEKGVVSKIQYVFQKKAN